MLRRFVAASTLLGLLTLAGCASRAYVGAEAPVGIGAYPSTYYDGHVVYWVDDRWYAQRDGLWVYYRSEPFELRRYRSRFRSYDHFPRSDYDRSTPRYNHQHHFRRAPRQVAPPSRHTAPPARRTAPPARR
jgi:hypothetical protein